MLQVLQACEAKLPSRIQSIQARPWTKIFLRKGILTLAPFSSPQTSARRGVATG
jgi:hypothetical protein